MSLASCADAPWAGVDEPVSEPTPTVTGWEEARWLTAEETKQLLDELGISPEDMVPPEAIEAERARQASAEYIYLSYVDAYVEIEDMGPEWPGDPQPVIIQGTNEDGTPSGEEFFRGKGGRLIPVPAIDEW